jgi:hypothetical protein
MQPQLHYKPIVGICPLEVKILNADVREIAANLQHVLVEKLENSAPNTVTRIILHVDGAKCNSDKQYDSVCD